MNDGILSLVGGIVIDGKLHTEVELREMTGYEEDILSDSRRAQDGSGKMLKSGSARMTEVLSRCTVRIGDVTPPDDGKEHPLYFKEAWDSAYVGDRGLATVFLRRLSLGDEYAFAVTCTRNSCGYLIPRVVHDLGTLPVRGYFRGEDEKFDKTAALLAGSLSFKTPKGRHVKLRFLRGSDEDDLQDIQEKRPDAVVSSLLYSSIEAIDGEPVKWADITGLPSRERAFIRDYISRVTGGLDLTIEIVCPKCGNQMRDRMNVGDPAFFFPSET